MGQQQLLITILVTIIIGIATIVAINTFRGASEAANVDAVRQDVIHIATMVQTYLQRPKMLGGADNLYNFTFKDISFNADSIEAYQGKKAINRNGLFVITGVGNGIEITVHPASRVPGNLTFDSEATESEGPLIADIDKNGLEWSDPN